MTVVAFLLAVKEPGAAPTRSVTLTRALQMETYTRAELLLMGRKGPFRPMFGPSLQIDVLHAIVKESRALRRRIGAGRTFTEAEYDDALENSDLTAADFFASGKDHRTGAPLFGLRPDSVMRANGLEEGRRVLGLPPAPVEDETPLVQTPAVARAALESVREAIESSAGAKEARDEAARDAYRARRRAAHSAMPPDASADA